jgi:hypothetical protein
MIQDGEIVIELGEITLGYSGPERFHGSSRTWAQACRKEKGTLSESDKIA